jgi:hypothetical protein
MHPRVGISNLPISQSVLNKLVTEAQLNEVYCEMAEDTTQVSSNFPANNKAMVSLSPLLTKRKRTPEDIHTSMTELRTQSMRDVRDMTRAKIDALNVAVLSRSSEKPSTPTTPPNDIAGQSKSTDSTNISNRWLELYFERDGPDRPVSLLEIQKATLRAMFPIIYNTNNKDITDDDNWAPCILIKVRKDQYEVLDVNGDLKVDEDIEWEGDDGLYTTWSMYHKYPSKTFVDSFCTRLQIVAEETEIQRMVSNATRRSRRSKGVVRNGFNL